MRPLHKFSLAAILVIAAGFLVWSRRADRPQPADGAPVATTTAAGANENPAPAAAATPASSESAASGPSDPHIETLKQVLASGNDNDPRLDSADFKNMSAETKLNLEKQYSTYAREKFNERGTIAFLIGRDLKTPEDAHFLFSILHEPTCKGLAVCERADAADSDGELAAGSEVTRAYPQLNAFRALAKNRETLKKLGLEREFDSLRESLRKSESSTLARLASEN